MDFVIYVNSGGLMLNRILKDSLYKNSLWLIASSIVLTGFGFFFWTINTWLFPSSDVGIASTLLAALELLVALSMLGFDTALIKFSKKGRMPMLNTCFNSSILLSVLLCIVFIAGISIFSPKLAFLKNPGLAIFFTISVVAYAIYTLAGSYLIGIKKSRLVFAKDLISSSLKLIFPFLLFGLAAFGIFASWSCAIIIGVVVSFFFVKYRPSISIDKKILRHMFSFSSANYVSVFLQRAPRLLLPFLITNMIGLSQTAYFHVSWTITSVLFIIPNAISKSLLAESTEKTLRKNVRKSLIFTYAALIPAVIVTVLVAKYLLLLFGTEYSQNAAKLLQIFAVSSLPFAANLIFIAVRNVQNKMRSVISINLIIAVSALTLSYIFIDQGLVAVAYSWLAAHGAFAFYSLWRLLDEK